MTSFTQVENAGLSSTAENGSESFKPHERDAGGDWARLCYVINDFRWVHGRWPTRFRMSAAQFASVRALFTPQDFAKITSKIEFITDPSVYKAEDERGASCGYRQQFLRAADWLGVCPERERKSTSWWRLW